MNSRFLPLATLAAAFVLGACNDVDYIEIKPQHLTLRQKNNEIWLQAHAMSHTGVHYSRATITWESADPSIATVDPTGRLRPVKSGRTEIIARSGKTTARTPVEVLYAEKMAVEPTSVTLKEGGDPVEFKVTVQDYQGRPLTDRTPTFHSLDKQVASMGQNAVFPVNAGATKVEVRVEDLLQTIDVKVDPSKTASAGTP